MITSTTTWTARERIATFAVLALAVFLWPRLKLVGQADLPAPIVYAQVGLDPISGGLVAQRSPTALATTPANTNVGRNIGGKVYGLLQISSGGQNRGYNPNLNGWDGIAQQTVDNFHRAKATGVPWDGIIWYRPEGVEQRAGMGRAMRFDGAVYRKEDAAAGLGDLKPGWGNDAELVRAFIRVEDQTGVQPLVYLGAVSVISEWNALSMAELDAKVRESVSWMHLYHQITGRPRPLIIIDDSGRHNARSTTWAVRLCLERQGFTRLGSEVTHRGSPWQGPETACTYITSSLWDTVKSGQGQHSWFPAKPGEHGHELIVQCVKPTDDKNYVRAMLMLGHSVALNMQGGLLPRDVK